MEEERDDIDGKPGEGDRLDGAVCVSRDGPDEKEATSDASCSECRTSFSAF